MRLPRHAGPLQPGPVRLGPVAALATLLACSGGAEPSASPPVVVEEPTPPPVVDRAAAEAAALDAAQAGIGRVGKALKGRLQEAMVQGGPEAAVEACADEAMGLTALAQGRAPVRVGRASLKRRNPRNTGPDWVQAWLLEAEAAAKAKGDALSVQGLREVVETPEGPVAHVLVPIQTEGLCLSCHGSAEEISPEVQAVLDARYPEDAATGYAAGELRGAFWAEAPVDLSG